MANATKFGRTKQVEKLLQLGADVNFVSPSNFVSIMYIVRNGNELFSVFFCVSWLSGFGNGLSGLQIYDSMSQNGHGRKEGSHKCV